jgi:hypothetical protein
MRQPESFNIFKQKLQQWNWHWNCGGSSPGGEQILALELALALVFIK